MTDQRVDASTNQRVDDGRITSGELVDRGLKLTRAIVALVFEHTAALNGDDSDQLANMATSAALAHATRLSLERQCAVLSAAGLDVSRVKVDADLIFHCIRTAPWESSIRVALELETLR